MAAVTRVYRFCRSPFHEGPTWLDWTHFYPKTWGDIEGTWVSQFQSQCTACQRISARIRQGVKRRTGHTITQLQQTGPNRARSVVAYLHAVMENAYAPRTKMAPEERAERKRQSYRDWIAVPENRARKREQGRDGARMRSLERGEVTNPRGPWLKYRKEPRLPAKPLVDWLTQAQMERLSSSEQDIIRKYKRGEQAQFTLESVDRMLTTLKAEHMLSVLYSDLT